MEFFKPDWKKILVLSLFIGIALGGSIQAWAFSGDEAGIPNPALYDFLAPFPLWPLWMMSTFPLLTIENILYSLFGSSYFLQQYSYLYWSIQTIYFYLISCFIILIGNKFNNTLKNSPRTFRKGLIISFLICTFCFVIITLVSRIISPLFSFDQGYVSALAFFILSSAPLWFLIVNSIGIVKIKDKNIRKGMSWGYLWIFLIPIIWMIFTYVAVAYH